MSEGAGTRMCASTATVTLLSFGSESHFTQAQVSATFFASLPTFVFPPPGLLLSSSICLLTSPILLICQGPFGATVLCACVIGEDPIVCQRISDHLMNASTSNMGQQKWGWGAGNGILMRNPRPSFSVIRQVAQVTNVNGKKRTNLELTLGDIHYLSPHHRILP